MSQQKYSTAQENGELVSVSQVLSFLKEPRNSESDAAATAVLDAISRLVQDNEENCATFGASPNFFHELIAVIRKHIASSSICDHGLASIRYLCRYNDSIQSQNNRNIAGLGASEISSVLVQILRLHGSSDEHVSSIAMRCIMYLTYDSADNKMMFGKANACAVISKILELHAVRSEEVAEIGFRCIQSIANNNMENVTYFGKTDASGVVSRVLKAHGLTKPKVAEAGLSAITVLCLDERSNAKFGHAEVCDTVLLLLDKYLEVDEVVVQAGECMLCPP